MMFARGFTMNLANITQYWQGHLANINVIWHADYLDWFKDAYLSYPVSVLSD